MSLRCTPWKEEHVKSGAARIISRCGSVELHVRPDSWSNPRGPASYLVKAGSDITARGHTKTVAVAKQQARRRAGAR